MKRLDGKNPFIIQPNKPRSAFDLYLVSSRECVWPECYGVKAMYGVPLCEEHALEVFDRVIISKPTGYLEARQNGAIAMQQLQEIQAQERRDRMIRRIKEAKTTAGWVYYIRIDGQIKIGWTGDVERRTRAYPPSSELLATHPGTKQVESDMHKKFAHLKTHGREWFREDPALDAHIAKVHVDFPDHQEKAYQFRDARGTSKAQPVKPRSYR